MFIKKLISSDYLSKAFDLIGEGLSNHPQCLQLKYYHALALARIGNDAIAVKIVRNILKDKNLSEDLKSEIISLNGRIEKDLYLSVTDESLKQTHAKRSATLYFKAFNLTKSAYSGINAATMFFLSGQTKKSQSIAECVIEQINRDLATNRNDYWILATLAEAQLILRKIKDAILSYKKAVELANDNLGDIASMWRNISLLETNIYIPEELKKIFSFGNVVVFSGHMIDHPDRTKSNRPLRFPQDNRLEDSLRNTIKNKLNDLNATIGYCSLAAGSDILFALEMLERKAELHIVLPFEKNDFYITSVDFGEKRLKKWRHLFDEILEKATEVHYATEEPYLGDDILFSYTNDFMQGLAINRANRLMAKAHALLVLEPQSVSATGGTNDFLQRWESNNYPYDIINLKDIRYQTVMDLKYTKTNPSPAKNQSVDQPMLKTLSIRREVKIMLFADVKNFSKL